MHARISFGMVLLCSVLFIPITDLSAQQSLKPPSANWTKGPAERFTGNVWVEYLVNDSINDLLTSRVLFEAGARSNWHYHSGKQIIFGVDGEGYYMEKGKPIKILKKGDVVIIEPGTIHSHGSIHSKNFIQAVMMNGIRERNATTWLTRVTEEELKN